MVRWWHGRIHRPNSSPTRVESNEVVILEVWPSAKDEIYRDMIRIPEKMRHDYRGRTVEEGRVCRISVVGRGMGRAIVRGEGPHGPGPWIRMDARLRRTLEITDKESDTHASFPFRLEECGPVGETLWSWNASEPSYRIQARIAVISTVAGLVGLALSLVALWIALGRPTP